MELSTVYALLPYDDDGHTPLHFLKAVYTQNDARAQSMIEFINTPIWGGTPLYWMRETPNAVQWLQQHGAEIVEPPTGISDSIDGLTNMRPEHEHLHTKLIWALIFDCQTSDHTLPRTAHFLRTLDRRARNAKEPSGYTALMLSLIHI